MAIVGINTFLWTVNWEGGLVQTLSNIKQLGFDEVQSPLLSMGSLNPKELFTATKEAGLECYISAGLKDETDVTSGDVKVRRKGIEYLKQCVHFAHEVGAPFLSGSFHSVFGKKSAQPVDDAQWNHAAESLRVVAEEAQKMDYCLALEPINRYESFLINTCSQARRLIDMIAMPNVKIQLDTFHMNIEEDDLCQTIRSAGEDLLHFHVAENHRGRFGRGTIPWDDVFATLATIRYKGAIVIECFVPEVPEVATAAAIWRKMAPSADALAQQGLEFIRDLANRYNL